MKTKEETFVQLGKNVKILDCSFRSFNLQANSQLKITTTSPCTQLPNRGLHTTRENTKTRCVLPL